MAKKSKTVNKKQNVTKKSALPFKKQKHEPHKKFVKDKRHDKHSEKLSVKSKARQQQRSSQHLDVDLEKSYKLSCRHGRNKCVFSG
jgi:hypothetical protein